jgi:acyl-coenzyme A thioesterase PaaI-like protein
MIDVTAAFAKARTSSFYRMLLNFTVGRMVPFNKPHRFRILEVGDDHIKTLIPYRKSNLNHIKGLHACALATISEFTTGLLLLARLDAKKYRLIMKRLEMDYHYQGKMDATAVFTITNDWLEGEIFAPLKNQESVVVECEIKIHDKAGNHLTTGRVFWQIKDWSRVKTKIPA